MSDSPGDTPTVGWDPDQYGRFEAERDRAAQDLIARIPSDLLPRQIWDFGCGPGDHARQFKRLYPRAVVHGLDSSADMLDRARAKSDDIDWRLQNLREWRPETPAELVFANASLHWLPEHETLIPRLASHLAPGGVLAIQMPLAWETRHHRVLRDVAADGPWAARLSTVENVAPLLAPERYYELLCTSCVVDVWATTYLHVLQGPDPVLEWMAGTALRPYLAALEGDEPTTTVFLSGLAEALTEAFPPGPDGATLLPFPRLFLMARRFGGV